MKTNDIRRAIDASLSGLKLSPEERRALLERATSEDAPLRRRRRLPRGPLLAALIAVLTLAIVVPAVGGPLRRGGIEFREDFVQLRVERGEDAPESYPETSFSAPVVAAWGEEFCDLLSSLGAQVLLPSWMPEGFRLKELYRELLELGKLDARYESDAGESLVIRVSVMGGESLTWSSSVESIPGSEEIWTLGGIEYTFTRNYGSCAVSWTEGNCTVVISAQLERETMRQMIESIYEARPSA